MGHGQQVARARIKTAAAKTEGSPRSPAADRLSPIVCVGGKLPLEIERVDDVILVMELADKRVRAVFHMLPSYVAIIPEI